MTIPTDVSDTGLTEDAAIAALVDQMKVAPKAPAASEDDEEDDLEADEGDEDEDDLEADEGDEDEDDGDEPGDDDEEDEGEDEDEAPPAAVDVSDDAVVKVTVNGEETEFTVGSLKRLAGQEASLTRKSQEVDLVGGRAAVMIQGAINTVLEDLEPYRDVDWLVLQQEMEPEEFKWHRENFARNESRYNRLMKDAGEFEQVFTARKQNASAEQTQAAIQELTTDVPGWNDELYGEIMQFAVSEGLDQDDVASITNPKVIKLLRKAMLHDRGEKVVAKKVNQAPARVKRPSGADEAVGNVNVKRVRNLERKMASGRGTDDDAVALLMGRWGVKPQ